MKRPFLGKKRAAAPVSVFRDWVGSIFFAAMIATLIRWMVIGLYIIPSGSMESTLLTGDFVLVSKLHYGARTPVTPLQIPITHQTIPGTTIPSYVDWITLPQYRLPGFSKVQRNDIIVFNTPVGTEPPDLREYWIKRCIAIPGDVVRIDHKQLYVNDELADTCDTIQYRYFMKTKRKLSPAFFEKNDITIEKSAISHSDTSIVSGHEGYIIYATPNKVKQLTTILPSYIQSVEPVEDKEMQPNNYSNSSTVLDDTKGSKITLTWRKGNFGLLVRTVLGWTKDNFGPLTVPKKGMSIHIDEKNILLYGHAIANFEGKKNIRFTRKECWIDGGQVKQYTFVKNYYFVMGDNRDQSKDSRFIGFIPAEHIAGKAVMVLLSSRKKSLFSGIRWNRLFHMVDK